MASGMPAFEMVFNLNSMGTSLAVSAMTVLLLLVDPLAGGEPSVPAPAGPFDCAQGRLARRPSLHRTTHRAVTVLVLLCPSNLPNQHEHGIIKFIHHALLQWDDRIVRDVDLLGTNFGAALGNVAEADAELVFQQARARFRVERMHFEGCNSDEKPRSSELFHLLVIAENVADILA